MLWACPARWSGCCSPGRPTSWRCGGSHRTARSVGGTRAGRAAGEGAADMPVARGAEMTMPNFLLIGAMKAGTTAFYQLLDKHPQVYMSPNKEPNFFAFEGEKLDFRAPSDIEGLNRHAVTEIEEYQALFDGVSGEKAIGEASHWYMYKPEASGRIKHHLPEAKLIAVLRDPAERAYSEFLHFVR